MSNKGLVTIVVIVAVILAVMLGAAALTDRTIFAGIFATLSASILLGALVFLKWYEIMR